MNYRGKISRIIGNDVYVQVSALAVDQDFGPMEIVDGDEYSVGDYVLVGQIDDIAEDLAIIGKLSSDLSELGGGLPAPTEDDSFLGGSSVGSYVWKTKTQTKQVLDIDDLETQTSSQGSTINTLQTDVSTLQAEVDVLQTEVQPVGRGGTGITSWTTGNYVRASGATTLQQRTPNQVKSDLGLDLIDNTSDANKPMSIASKAYVDALPSGVWGTSPLDKHGSDSTIGNPIYVDSAGKIRIRPTELTAAQRAGVWTDASPPGDFPVGTTTLQITNTSGSADGWPGGTSGTVITTRRANEGDSTACGQQWFHRTTASQSLYKISYRSGSGNPTAWGPWVSIFDGDTGWQNITFADANWSAYGGVYQTPQYRLRNGTVKLRGLVLTSVSRTGNNIPITTMFASMAPTATDIFWQAVAATSTTGPASTGTAHTHNYPSGGSNSVRVDVLSSGNVNLMADSGRTIPVNGWVSLAGITWDIS